MVALASVPSAWRQDILRKTWISYRLAEVGDEQHFFREAGNSPDVIYRCYFDLVNVEAVRRFGGGHSRISGKFL